MTTRDPGRNEALWITARAEKCLWITPRYACAADGKVAEGLAAVPVGGGAWACPPKSRMQFDWVKFQQSLETLQFQRCEFKV
ncbi:MAG: hypothetical protein E6044_09760 [Actinomyces sp.]|nr:hypothetical protein [Actinomyces sp.]